MLRPRRAPSRAPRGCRGRARAERDERLVVTLADEKLRDRAAHLIAGLYTTLETLRGAAERDEGAAMLAAYATLKVLHGELAQVSAQGGATAARPTNSTRLVNESLRYFLDAARALAHLEPRGGHPLQLHTAWALTALDALQSEHGFALRDHPILRAR
jgi:hypothetical protein